MERSNKTGWAQVRAGIFIFIALLCIVAGILLMGQKTKMFVAKGKLQVVMEDVAGLKIGAPVWLAGVDVGVVTDISFANPKSSNEITIVVEVNDESLKKIGTDSKITIKTRGLMGEKYVDVTPSQQYSESPPTILRGTPVAKLDDVVQKAGLTFDHLNKIVNSISHGEGSLGKLSTDPSLYNNMSKLSGELASLAYNINHSQGTLGKLIKNPEAYNKLVNILERADKTINDIQGSEGTMNKLIYDTKLYDKLVLLAEKSNQAADDVRELNKKLTSKNSTFGMLVSDREIYDKGLELINRADNSLKSIEEVTNRVNNGEGTAGKLISNQELYERTNRMIENLDALIKDFKAHPKKYIKFSVF